jgi:hypothetical protein
MVVRRVDIDEVDGLVDIDGLQPGRSRLSAFGNDQVDATDGHRSPAVDSPSGGAAVAQSRDY